METFERDDLQFDVRVGGPSDGDPVLLLHGFPQDSSAFDLLAEPLHKAGYRTFAPDQRGYSPGARPAARRDYQQAELVADAVALMDSFELPKAHVVGHDWGGFVAWGIASEHPERCATVTALSTPHPGAFKAVALSSSQLLKSWYMGVFQIPHVAERLLRPGHGGWGKLTADLPPQFAARYTEHMSDPAALTAALNWYRSMPLDIAKPSLRVHRIAVPTLYIWGDHDPALGRAAAEATAKFVKAKYEFIPLSGAGHWLPETEPQKVSGALLEFWRVNQIR